MAIAADGPFLVTRHQELSMDALIVSRFDLHMTFAASLRDIRVIDRRIAVDASLDVVNTMAIVTEGATISPILSSALPWMLSMYWDAASGSFIWYSFVSPGLLWQTAQVRGRFSLNTGDSGFFTGSM